MGGYTVFPMFKTGRRVERPNLLLPAAPACDQHSAWFSSPAPGMPWIEITYHHHPPSSGWSPWRKNQWMNKKTKEQTNSLHHSTVQCCYTWRFTLHFMAALPYLTSTYSRYPSTPCQPSKRVARRCASVIEGRQALAMSCWFLRGKIFFGIQGQIWLQPAFFWGGANPWFPWYLEIVCRKFPKMEVLWTFHRPTSPFWLHIRTWDSSLGIPQHIPERCAVPCSGDKIDKPTEKIIMTRPLQIAIEGTMWGPPR